MKTQSRVWAFIALSFWVWGGARAARAQALSVRGAQEEKATARDSFYQAIKQAGSADEATTQRVGKEILAPAQNRYEKSVDEWVEKKLGIKQSVGNDQEQKGDLVRDPSTPLPSAATHQGQRGVGAAAPQEDLVTDPVVQQVLDGSSVPREIEFKKNEPTSGSPQWNDGSSATPSIVEFQGKRKP